MRQAPAMVMAFIKPSEDGSPPALGKDARIALQPFPGPLQYPYMHQFLTMFAGMMGYARGAPASRSPAGLRGQGRRMRAAPPVLLEAKSNRLFSRLAALMTWYGFEPSARGKEWHTQCAGPAQTLLRLGRG